MAWSWRAGSRDGEKLTDSDSILKLKRPGKCDGLLPVNGGDSSRGRCGFVILQVYVWYLPGVGEV